MIWSSWGSKLLLASKYVQDDGRLPFVDKRNITTEFADDFDFSVLAIDKVISEAIDTYNCETDGFSCYLLKRLKCCVSLPLSLIFNLSYESGSILEVWIQAVVCPVYKGAGSRVSTENYRSICLTSTCCKIMESLITKTILKYMKVNNFLTPLQHRF